MEFLFESNQDQVRRELRELARKVADPDDVLDQWGEHMLNDSIPENFRQGGRPDRWPRSPWELGSGSQRDSGRLMRGVRKEPGPMRIRIGTNDRRAVTRHYGAGGTGSTRPPIKARNGKALVVPLPDLPRSMRRPSRWGKRLFFVPSRKGQTSGVLATRRGDQIVPRFVLRKSVKQPARPFLVAQDEDLQVLRELLIEALGGEA